MKVDMAYKLIGKVDFAENTGDCWIPKYKTNSVRHKKKMYSIAYLSYILSGHKIEFRKKQHIPRLCGNSRCFNPRHLIFDEIARFLFYTEVDEKTRCWNWKKSKDGGGYGVFMSSKYGREKAHRVAFMEFVGRIPDDMFVCHKCDNPSCCNPTHLFLGTHTDNMRDMQKKGRKAILLGEDAAPSKLSKNDVEKIRDEYKLKGISQRQLSRKYKISQSQVGRILRKESWAWVSE